MTWTQEEKDRYRFSGERYSFRNANGSRAGEYIPQFLGFYAFPAGNKKTPSILTSSSSSSLYSSSSSSFISSSLSLSDSFLNSSSLSSLSSLSSSSSSSSIERYAGISHWTINDNFIVGVDSMTFEELQNINHGKKASSSSSGSLSSLNSSSSSNSSLSSHSSSSLSSSSISSSSISSSSISSSSKSSVSSPSSSSISSSSKSSVSSTSSSSQSDEPLPEDQTRVAVFVSIEDYPNTSNDLIGYFHNTTDEISEVLKEKFDFETVSRLKDTEATKTNVEAAIVSATSNLVPGDSFFFFYGGHGSQWKDNNGNFDETDKLDEMRILYNSVWLDDWIRLIIDAIPAGVKVTFVFDSCYSGTATRDVSKPRMMSEENMRELFFSASTEGGLAYGWIDAGIFSAAFLEVLKTSGNGITAKEFYNRIKTKNFRNLQEPQLEGPEALKNSRVFV